MFRILLALLLMTTPSWATVQWRNGTGANTLLGSSNASDIDTNTYNNIVSPLDSLLANYREGVNVNYDSANQFTVSSGSITVSNSDGSIRLFLKNSGSTTVTWSDIDTGAEASGTTYYVYAIAASASATAITFKISASSTSPSGITYYKRIGSFYNDSSSNITLITNDNQFSGGFAASSSKSASTVYQALTDGFVCADSSATSTGGMQMDIYSDSTSSPTTLVRSVRYGNSSLFNIMAVCEPIIKGYYYKVVLTNVSVQNNIRFYPVGQ